MYVFGTGNIAIIFSQGNLYWQVSYVLVPQVSRRLLSRAARPECRMQEGSQGTITRCIFAGGNCPSTQKFKKMRCKDAVVACVDHATKTDLAGER